MAYTPVSEREDVPVSPGQRGSYIPVTDRPVVDEQKSRRRKLLEIEMSVAQAESERIKARGTIVPFAEEIGLITPEGIEQPPITARDLAAGFAETGKTFLQAVPRAIFGIEAYILGKALGQEGEFQPTTKTEQAILGRDVISAKKSGKEFLEIFGAEEAAEKFAVPTGLGLFALDLVPIPGGGKGVGNLSKIIAKTKDVNVIEPALRSVFKGKDVKKFATELVDVDDPATVRKMLETRINEAKRPPAPSQRVTEEDFYYANENYKMLKETLQEHPARSLAKFESKTLGGLPELTGNIFVKSRTGSGRTIKESKFGRFGDQMISELGFEDAEQARDSYLQYKELRQKVRDFGQEMLEMRRNLSETKKFDKAFLDDLQTKLKASFEKLKITARAERVGFRRGAKETLSQIKTRRGKIRALQEIFSLDDAAFKKIRGTRNFHLMSDREFDDFLQELENRAQIHIVRREARIGLEATIFEKEFRKVENLRQALKLPVISEMNTEQLKFLDETLQQYKTGDEFLSVRKLELVDRTDLRGIRTIREARERLAKELNVSPDNLNEVKVHELDQFRFDTALAERNPFYKMMVEETASASLNANARFLTIQRQIDELVGAARASRKRRIIERLIPQDKLIFDWLEAPESRKGLIAQKMTPEEIRVGEFIRDRYAEMRDYLIQMQVLKKYRSDYITHIRAGFLETWREEGFLGAFKNIFKQYQQDEAIFNILDQDTGQILALEKFFQFSMRRTGNIRPTQNVAKAFLVYTRAFEKKVGLDSIVPKLDIYVHSLTPKTYTQRGLEFDRSLKRFVNEWINTKKGRTRRLIAKQGGRLDLSLRALKMLTVIHDLGLNIPVGIAAQFGEQATTYTLLGAKKYALGIRRLTSANGRLVTKKYENFVGRSPWDELFKASSSIGDSLTIGLLGLFRDATTRANKIFLLGSMSDEEFKALEISSKRLAGLRTELGRYRVVEDASSIIGATTEGGLLTQYKKWAIPVLRTTASNFAVIGRLIRTRGPFVVKTKEFQELFRSTIVIGSIGLTAASIYGDEKDESFVGKILQKSYRDAMTTLGSLDPATLASVPRVAKFIADLGKAISDIIKLETYKEKEGLKGVGELRTALEPALSRQFRGGIKSALKEQSTGQELPEFPSLPELPELPSLPSL